MLYEVKNQTKIQMKLYSKQIKFLVNETSFSILFSPALGETVG